jgi:hypothetical protein
MTIGTLGQGMPASTEHGSAQVPFGLATCAPCSVIHSVRDHVSDVDEIYRYSAMREKVTGAPHTSTHSYTQDAKRLPPCSARHVQLTLG